MIETDEFDAGALPRLERMIGGEEAEEVLELYLSSTRERMAAVHAGLAAGDPRTVARALHDLKSSAGMVGAEGARRLAEELERLAWGGELERLAERLGRLESVLARAAVLLGEARKKRGG